MFNFFLKQIEYSIISRWDNYNNFENKYCTLNLLDVNKNPEYKMKMVLKVIPKIEFIPLKSLLDIR